MDRTTQRLRDLLRNNYSPVQSKEGTSFLDLQSIGDDIDFIGIQVSEETGIAAKFSGGYVGVIGVSTTEEIGVWGWTTGSGLLEQKPDTSGDVDIATDAALTSNPGVSIYGLTDGGTAGRFIATGGGRGIVGSTDDATLAGVVARNTASPTPGPALVCENSYAYFEAGLVVNGAGGSATTSDTRIAGDTDTHLIFVDASADKVGISEPAPNATLDVNGTTRLGDSDTNYAAFAADGSQTMHGTATLTSANGIISPVWKPASDSTTAMQMQTSAGGLLLNADTTAGIIGIGGAAPGYMDARLFVSKSVNSTIYNSYAAHFVYSIYNPSGTITSYGSGIDTSVFINGSGQIVNGDVSGGNFYVTNYNSAKVQSITGGKFFVWFGDGVAGSSDLARAGHFQVLVQDSAIADVYGTYTDIVVDTGTVTRLCSHYIPSTTLGAGTITNNYGLLIEDVSVGTNKYAIYTKAGNVIFNGAADANSKVGIGTASPASRLDIDAGAMTMAEMTAPTGAANKAMLYTKDNGSGKTQLCCKLGDDVEIVIATQA